MSTDTVVTNDTNELNEVNDVHMPVDAPADGPSEQSDADDPIVVNASAHEPAPPQDVLHPKKRQRVSKYTEILKAELQDTLERRGDVFIAPLKKPLHILTPTVTLSGDLHNAEGDLEDYVTLKLKRSHAEVFGNLEDLLLEKAKQCKVSWFNNPDIQDEFLDQSLRRFFDKETRLLTVRLDEGLGGKSARKGEKVKVVLHADGAIMTRTQYGFLWKMEMIKSIEKNEDMYLFDPEEDPAADGLATGDLLDHVDQDGTADEFLR